MPTNHIEKAQKMVESHNILFELSCCSLGFLIFIRLQVNKTPYEVQFLSVLKRDI